MAEPIGVGARPSSSGSHVPLMIELIREGRCASCGVHTHKFVWLHDGRREKEPLTIEGEVHRGRCLFCQPFKSNVVQASSLITTNSRSRLETASASPRPKKKRKKKASSSSSATTPPTHDLFDSRASVVSSSPEDIHSSPLRLRSSPDSVSSSPRQRNTRTTGPQSIATETVNYHSADNNSVVASPSKHDNLNRHETRRMSPRKKLDPVSEKIQKIINSALEEPTVPKVQDKACENLRKICKGPSDATKIIELGGLSLIIKAMKEHPDKTIVQAEACGALSALVWVDSDNGPRIESLGAMPLVVTAMKRHKAHSKVLQMGCGVLRVLSYDASNNSCIMSNDGIRVVVEVMNNNPRKVAVLKEGCEFLQNMAYHSCDVVANIAVEKGVIDVIVAAMDSHPNDEDLQESSCGFLKNLALHGNTKSRIVDAGAIPVLKTAMKNCPSLAATEEACAALRNLAAHNTENKVSISEDNFFDDLISAMKSFPDSENLQTASCELLQFLSYNDDNGAQLAASGGVDAIVSGMTKFLDSEDFQEAACCVLTNVDVLCNESTRAAARAVLSAMAKHPDKEDIQLEACRALSRMARAPQAAHLLMEQKARSLLERAREEFPECESLVSELMLKCDAQMHQTGQGSLVI